MMKRFAIFMVCMAALVVGQAQNKQQGYYDKQYAKLYKTYLKQPNNVVNLLEMSQFFSSSDNPMFNLPSAMKYILSAEQNYVEIIENDKRYSEARDAIKKGITVTTVRQQKQYIIMSARQYLKDHGDISTTELDNFASSFSGDALTMRLIEAQRIKSAFAQTKATNTIEAYLQFQSKYPGTEEAEEADRQVTNLASTMFKSCTTEKEVDQKLSSAQNVPAVQQAAVRQKAHIAYLEAAKKNDAKSYQDYLRQYPSGDDYALALERLNDLVKAQYESMTDADELVDFITLNEDNPLAEQAMERLRSLITDNQDARAAELYLQKFPLDDKYNDIYLQCYRWYAYEGDRQPIMEFRDSHTDFPYQQSLQRDLNQCDTVDKLGVDLTGTFKEADFQKYVSFIRKTTGKGIAFVGLQRMLQPLITAKQWPAVEERMNYVMLSFEDYDSLRFQEIKSVINATPSANRHLKLEAATGYNIIHPALHPNGHQLYFTKVTGTTSTIHVAEQSGGIWKSAGNVTFTNAENKDMKFFCLFDEGEKMLLGKNDDIFMAFKDGASWTIDEAWTNGVNTNRIETDGCMTADGSGMLFASDRPYGHDFHNSGDLFHGDTAPALDIYFIPRVNDRWGDPVNLGMKINGNYCEHSPALSVDGKTLYYITDGRGFGYGDVYMAQRDDVADWTSWGEPVNLGKEVNTGYREGSVTLTGDDSRLYISSNRAGGRFACYSMAAVHEEGVSLKPVTIDGSDLSMVKSLGVVDLTAQSQIKSIDVSASTSETMKLYPDHEYVAYAETDDYWVPGVKFSPTETETVSPKGYSASQVVSQEEVPLYAVRFETSSSSLTQAAQEELARLGRFLANNPNFWIELTVNVDGTDADACYSMSVDRGRRIRKALEKAGAADNQVNISPYGNYQGEHKVVKDADVTVRFYEKAVRCYNN